MDHLQEDKQHKIYWLFWGVLYEVKNNTVRGDYFRPPETLYGRLNC